MKALIAQELQHAVDALKADAILPTELNPAIRVDDARDKAHGDYASNLAMILAKPAGKPPREIAQALIDALPSHPAIAAVEIAGPGFLNFRLDADWLGRSLKDMLRDAQLGVAGHDPAQRVVIDYSAPNLAKEMHVGHLRSTIIGDAMVRVLEFLGDTVIRQNHLGDWGTQFGMLLAAFEATPLDGETALADLEGFYRDAKQRFDADPAFAARARELVVALQGGDEQCLALWRSFTEISLKHCQALYDRLGVRLTRDDAMGESRYNDDLPVIIDDLRQQKLLSEDQGALCVFQDEFRNKDGEPLPLIVQKKGGGYLYATTDLAAIRHRVGTLQADRILYVVDQRQGLHFEQVFSVARKAGWLPASVQVLHVGFGTLNGEDGKPFKTRAGGTIKLADLLDEAESRARVLVREKLPDEDEASLNEIARVVAIGSVKYADLSKNRNSDYIFSFDQMLSFDGNTAPYLLYAVARINSLLRRAGVDPATLDAPLNIEADAEQSLALHLSRFPQIVNDVAEKALPHLLCNYLYETATLYSAFYENCPILNNEHHRDSRLQLSALAGRTLKQGLNLLGIETLERM